MLPLSDKLPTTPSEGNIWCPKESGGLCGNGGALGYQVVETTQKNIQWFDKPCLCLKIQHFLGYNLVFYIQF